MSQKEPEDDKEWGSGSGTGKPASPVSPPTPADAPPGALPQDVPIGVPVAPDEFKRMKDRARRPSPSEEPAIPDEKEE